MGAVRVLVSGDKLTLNFGDLSPTWIVRESPSAAAGLRVLDVRTYLVIFFSSSRDAVLGASDALTGEVTIRRAERPPLSSATNSYHCT